MKQKQDVLSEHSQRPEGAIRSAKQKQEVLSEHSQRPEGAIRSAKLKVDLVRALPDWVARGLLSPEQSQRIFEYQKAARRPRKVLPLPLVAMALAAVLIAVGLFMFYAANWRHMSAAAKLVQVFGLVAGFYGAGLVLGLRKGAEHPLARVFVVLGMVSFGLAISLIAQIFHISSHPTNGVLAWFVAVMVMTALTRERWGLYLGGLLLLIWNNWEISGYQTPNHLFIALTACYGVLAWREKSAIAQIAFLAFILQYFFQAHLLTPGRLGAAYYPLAVALLPFFYGLLFIEARRLAERLPADSDPRAPGFPRAALITAELAGWFLVFMPFLSLSWPIPFEGSKPLFLGLLEAWPGRAVLIQAALLSAALLFLHFRNRETGSRNPLAPWVVGFAVALFAMPLTVKTWLMTVTHLGMLAFFFAFAWFAFTGRPEARLRRVLALVFPGAILLIKFFGFLFLAVDRHAYFVSYLVGFTVFAIVVLLIGQLVKSMVEKRGGKFPDFIWNLVVCVLVFWSLYALSFKVHEQNSIFTTGSTVLTLVFALLAVAVGLFTYLARLAAEKLVTALAGIIFTQSVAMMFLAHPDFPWEVYALCFNFLLFILEGSVLWLGTKRGSRGLQLLGIAFFFIHVTTRYFDLVWDLLSGSALFIATGVLVLALGALLERQRRQFARAKAPSPPIPPGGQEEGTGRKP